MNLSKKASIISFTLIMLLGWTGICIADGDTLKTIEYDSERYHYNYNETDSSGKWADSEKGWMNAISILYKSLNLDTNRYWQFRFDQTTDYTTYNGSYLDTGESCQSTTGNVIWNLEYTYAIPMFDYDNIHLLIGLGCHMWDRQLSTSQDEFYHWFYIPIGLRWEYGLSENLEGALAVTANFMFDGQMDAEMTGYEDFTVDLGNKPGFKIALPLTYHLSTRCSIGVTPWYEYSSIGKSNIVPLYYSDGSLYQKVYEPDSTTKQYGIDFGVKWYF